MNKYKIQEGKCYKNEHHTLIVQALETTNSALFSGAVLNNHIHFELGYVGNWYSGSFTEVEHTEQIVQNELFPIY